MWNHDQRARGSVDENRCPGRCCAVPPGSVGGARGGAPSVRWRWNLDPLARALGVLAWLEAGRLALNIGYPDLMTNTKTRRHSPNCHRTGVGDDRGAARRSAVACLSRLPWGAEDSFGDFSS